MLEISIQLSAIRRFEERKNTAELRNNGLLLQMTMRGMVPEHSHEEGIQGVRGQKDQRDNVSGRVESVQAIRLFARGLNLNAQKREMRKRICWKTKER